MLFGGWCNLKYFYSSLAMFFFAKKSLLITLSSQPWLDYHRYRNLCIVVKPIFSYTIYKYQWCHLATEGLTSALLILITVAPVPHWAHSMGP